ncbi:Autophagy-related protein 33 [Colletotrichum sidae]|uniref:Autophagy-related protein 33 n=4 Tax=Colletotrichum orbiculare species complex TaxID=2707354 RepID=N4V7T2_COLOR|nr:Autophagy-related protein 33 [Colletotrichum orbiculare MAFF 240422]TDZ34897.1 Autophagy-related protein 33 [Colletotrichum spinosum]TDZ65880.1 Autophagy-related protein 33 [Colletotrichum trifolii]TEA18832.1 Autophagy-related protein 33 [Colletotrichum sidae]
MTSKGVSLLKFVGTVSLGLLTGISYSLSTVTVPSILSLPSSSDALRAFQSLLPSATTRQRVLTGASTASFLLAFLLSPRAFRHPYLIYSSVFCLTSGLAEQIAPYVLKSDPAFSKTAVAERRQARRQREAERRAARIARQEARMEASYEVLGDNSNHSDDEGAAAAAAALAEDEETLNGEEVRGEVELFRNTQIVQTAIASVGFLLSVVGIWGDGAIQVFQTETVIVGV